MGALFREGRRCALYNVWEVCIPCGSFAYCVGALYSVYGALYNVKELYSGKGGGVLCIMCGRFAYCAGALYSVWELCILCGSFVYSE